MFPATDKNIKIRKRNPEKNQGGQGGLSFGESAEFSTRIISLTPRRAESRCIALLSGDNFFFHDIRKTEDN